MFEDYDMKKPLGQGSNGSTHLAVRKKDGRSFALKLSVPPNPQLLDHPCCRPGWGVTSLRFSQLCINTKHANQALKEAKVLSQLDHKSIVKYEDVFLEDAKVSPPRLTARPPSGFWGDSCDHVSRTHSDMSAWGSAS